jgi:hypothetical protein
VRSSEALLLLYFIASISVISTLLLILLFRFILDFYRFMYGIDFWRIDL